MRRARTRGPSAECSRRGDGSARRGPTLSVPEHSHHNEQLIYIFKGKLRFCVGDDFSQVFDVEEGQVLHLPSNVPHKAAVLEETLDVDIFGPPRREWLDHTDDYFQDQ